jgi:hypothetical protein
LQWDSRKGSSSRPHLTVGMMPLKHGHSSHGFGFAIGEQKPVESPLPRGFFGARRGVAQLNLNGNVMYEALTVP